MESESKYPITVPGGVTVSQEDRVVTVKGPKGELQLTIPDPIEVAIEDNTVTVTRPDDER